MAGMMISHDEADALWNNLRDVLNAQAEWEDECVGCSRLIVFDSGDPSCEECGFDPTLHDHECEILAQANRDAAYWYEAQEGGCKCQCSARRESAIQSTMAARAALTDIEYQALILDNIAKYGTPIHLA